MANKYGILTSKVYVLSNLLTAQPITVSLKIPPKKPTIDGPNRGKAGTEYTYTFTNPGTQNVYVLVDWCDKTMDFDPITIGDGLFISHTWEEQGDYTIKARAMNEYGMMSDWEELSVSMPKKEAYSHPNPSGIIAAFAVHNTRDEIWDAMNNCSIYGSQLLKIRANVRFDGQMALGQWINCSSPLKVRITAHSTFPGKHCSGRNMCPHKYLSAELDYPIQDIWLLKKDRDRGRPWCKVIGHATPNENMAVVSFEDIDVQPNDFYYVAIRQKGQELAPQQNEYMAFIGPVFINNVV